MRRAAALGFLALSYAVIRYTSKRGTVLRPWFPIPRSERQSLHAWLLEAQAPRDSLGEMTKEPVHG